MSAALLPGSPCAGSASTLITSAVMTHTTSTTQVNTSASKPAPHAWFTSEIQLMMYGLGDCRKPLCESANLIEQIVHKQLTSLLYKVEDIARMRTARFIGIEDFLFLLRKDRVKLHRLVRYMEIKDLKQTSVKPTMDDESEEADGKPPLKRRKKMCYDFLNMIDQTGELTSFFDDETSVDEIKHTRALRADMQTRSMDAQEYKEFAEARQSSFTPRYKTQKFKDWLLQGISLDIKPSLTAIEVLSYMAFETVAQIMDLALIVKRDASAKAADPFSKLMAHSMMNYDSLQNAQGQMLPPQSTSVVSSTLKSPSSSAPASPLTSPPSTPTTPGSGGFAFNLNSSTGSTKSRSSKKKKKGNSSNTREMHTYNAITPQEIWECVRRYSSCVGPFAQFSKTPLTSPTSRLFCG